MDLLSTQRTSEGFGNLFVKTTSEGASYCRDLGDFGFIFEMQFSDFVLQGRFWFAKEEISQTKKLPPLHVGLCVDGPQGLLDNSDT